MPENPTDDELEALVGDALAEFDPIPAKALSFARESQRLVELEGELASLVSDSLVGADERRSSAPTARQLQFGWAELVISVEFDSETVRGSIEGAPATEIAVEQLNAAQIVALSERGTFRFDRPQRPFRLAVTSGESVIRTQWITDA